MISWEREHCDTKREEQESESLVNHHLSSSSLLSHSFFIPPCFVSNSFSLLKKIQEFFPQSLSKPHSLCVPHLSQTPPRHPHRDPVYSLRLCLCLSHTYRGTITAGVLSPSLCHIYSLRLTLCSPRQSPASFYFSVSSWQQHHIIRLNPRANMPPHLNRLRRMRAATALQTHFLQSILFQLVFFTPVNTLLHAQFLRKCASFKSQE